MVHADDGETDYVHGHVWGVTAKMDLTDSWLLYAGYSDWDYSADDALCAAAAGNCSATAGDATHWTVGAQWDMAPGLRTKFEYTKTNDENDYGVGAFAVRVIRSF